MKLSKVIRKAQHELMYPRVGNNLFLRGPTLHGLCYYSCSAVWEAAGLSRIGRDKAADAYSNMLLEYGFVHGSPGKPTWRHRGIKNPCEVTQQFRLHMMELMACIAEDEGN